MSNHMKYFFPLKGSIIIVFSLIGIFAVACIPKDSLTLNVLIGSTIGTLNFENLKSNY